jgi:uncharacterized membrane protein
MFQEVNRKLHKHSFKSSFQNIISISVPILVFTIFTLYWGNILWLKYDSLHDYVFDSGVFLDSLYQIYYFHSISTIVFYLGSSPGRIILSPLSVFHSIILLLYIQLLAVLGSSFVIYYTIRKLTGNVIMSSLFSVLYLFYFPIDGSLFFDVHAQTFFVPFFLLGFMFQVMNRKYLSVVFFLLAGMTRFPLIGIVVVYSILDFIRNFRLNRTILDKSKFKSLLNFDMILFGVAFILLFFEYLIEHDYYGVQVVSLGYLHVQSAGILSNLSSKVITIIFFSAPFLFLVLYVNEFSIILWGLFGFIFYANYSFYYYPEIFTDQYSSVFTSVIFLILMVFLSEYCNNDIKITSQTNSQKSLKVTISKVKKSTVTKIAISVIIFAILLEPISPISSDMGTHFNIESYTSFGESNNMAVMQMAKLIPANASGVLIQNDLPQILTHDYSINPNFVGETLGYPLNYTANYFNSSTSLKYIIGYLGASSFYESSQGLSQYSIIQNALSSRKYGLFAENGELILLKRSYAGSPTLFIHSEHILIPQSEMISLTHPNDENGTVNETDNSLYYNGNFFLLPGEYQLNFSITTYSGNVSASLNFQIYGHLAEKDNLNNTVNIAKGKTNLSFEFIVNNVYLLRYLSITASKINGQMRLDSISIKQLN